MDIRDYNRIMLVGSPGSGKSFLARALAKTLGYDLIHLDVEYWQPNWVNTPKAEWEEKHQQLISGHQWIIDGNYSSTMEARWQAADLVIHLDTSRWLCLWRVIHRHGNKREDLPQYLEERYNQDFLAFLKYIWDFPHTKRGQILALRAKYADQAFLILKNKREIQQVLDL